MNLHETEFHNQTTCVIVAFLRRIGIEVSAEPLDAQTVLPGIEPRGGTLVVDETKLRYPGDLLHEAGHLAVVPPERRGRMTGSVGQKAYEEMSAIAWSYAAAVHLALDPTVVFHAEGYRGGSQSLIENFSAGRYVGVPVLEWLGLTVGEKAAAERGVAPYPRMLKWMVD